MGAAFTKTSNPYWYMDDTPANIAAVLKAEGIMPSEVISATQSNTTTQVFLIVRRGEQL